MLRGVSVAAGVVLRRTTGTSGWWAAAAGRGLCAAAPAAEADGDAATVTPVPKTVSPAVQDIADAIAKLNLLEMADLCDVLKDSMGMARSELFMPVGAGGGGGGGVGAGDGGAGAEAEEEPAEARTHFDVKLTGFDAKAKIKIIKEVRGVTSLGLKEAKELVESAPCVLTKDMAKDAAEELVAKLKELGGEVELE